jgi:integrase
VGVPDPAYTSQWLRRPHRPKTIWNLHGLLYSIFQDAIEADPPLRSANPAARTRLPRRVTEEEFHLLRDCARSDVRDMLTVFVGTGLRYSELTALQVRDIDLNATPRPTLRVRRAWKRRGRQHLLSRPAQVTKTSRRTMVLSDEVYGRPRDQVPHEQAAPAP